jgi:hypothetical protein
MLITFSLILESVCILPQLLLLRQTSVPTVIDSYYLLTLGLYRALYIFNWIEREFDDRWKPLPIPIIFGVIQTAFYCDFAWIYYSRQRVKLRGGGVVDGDDLTKGWLLSKIFSMLGKHHEEDEESRPALHPEDDDDEPSARPGATRNESSRANGSSRWGPKGISVSADDGVLENESQREDAFEDAIDAPDAKMRDPDELARDLDDDDSDDDDGVLPSHHEGSSAAAAGVSGGEEWRDGSK